jgi:Holliday junction resolvasome RuvABC ATP-dependent DNA helicase subunit
MESSITVTSSATLRKLPRRIRLREISANHRSTRFRQIIELEAYNDEELRTIIRNGATRLAFDLPVEVAHQISIRSQGTTRTAMTNLMWYRDYVQADGGIATMEALNAAFEWFWSSR